MFFKVPVVHYLTLLIVIQPEMFWKGVLES